MANDWKQDTVKITDGIELSYLRTGNGDKPALVMAHGIADQGSTWHHVAEGLESDYDLIMYDANGHGKSSRINPKNRFDMAEDMHDFILALGLEKPGVIGHSMGAGFATVYAARYPELLSCLILEDPPWFEKPRTKAVSQKGMADRKAKNLVMKEKSLDELIAEKRIVAPQREEETLSDWAQGKLNIDPAVFDLDPLPTEDWRDLLKAIKAPTLIITGDNELGALVTPALGVEAIELLAHGEFGHISNAGHCVRYEQYGPYMTMLKLFLKRNLKG